MLFKMNEIFEKLQLIDIVEHSSRRMSQTDSKILAWTEKIKSDSRVLDPIGIQYHTRLQGLYVPGITSVTNRMRYYTLQAWF